MRDQQWKFSSARCDPRHGCSSKPAAAAAILQSKCAACPLQALKKSWGSIGAGAACSQSPVPAFASLTRQHSACNSAIQNPSDSRTIEASFGCLVPRTRASTCSSHLTLSSLQVALSAVTAAVALVRFVQWKRLDETDRDTIWRLYGVFTCLAFVGSICGVVTWSIFLVSDRLYIGALSLGTSANDRVQRSAELGSSYELRGPFHVSKALTFLFVSLAKLMVLDRMMQFTAKRAQGALVRRMGAVRRVVLGIVLVVNAVGVAATLASTPYFALAAGADSAAAAAFSKNNTAGTTLGTSLLLDAERHIRVGNTCVAVGQVCIVACLLDIMTTFLAAGVLVAVRIREFLVGVGLGKSTSSARSARYLLVQTCLTVAVVFTAFLIRTAFEIALALGAFYNLKVGSSRESCGICDPCQSDYYLLHVWIDATPEVMASVMVLAEPVTLLIALWGMTSERGARLLNHRRDSRVQSMQSPKSNTYRDSLLDP
jgi:hypothetical protein